MAHLKNVAILLAVLINVLLLPSFNAGPRFDQQNGCDGRISVKRYVVISDKSRTFLEAWRFCASFGLRLATVTSAEESRLLDQAVNGTGNVPAGSTWWIGGTNLGREGSFIWISTNLPVGYKTGYFNFSPGQPDNYKGVENCLEIGRFGPTMWNDMPCDTKLHFVCEDFDISEK
uniref:C-type lectin domain-containing protein n=1 Tax=Anopheles atroparvus TaxID=41427 RepID=A0AAG5D2I2_ANOAO